MPSTLRLAAVACCALGAVAAGGSSDGVHLVQQGLRVGGGAEGNGMAQSSEAARDNLRFKRALGQAVYSTLTNGEGLFKLLWGNGTEPAGPIPTFSKSTPGCSAGDWQAAFRSVGTLHDRATSSITEILDKLRGGAMPGVPLRMKEVPDLLPQSCEILAGGEGFTWGDVTTCVQKALDVSAGCLQCIPHYAQLTADSCRDTCVPAFQSIRGKLHDVTQQAPAKIATSFFSLSGQAAVQSLATEAAATLGEALKEFAPCHQCAGPKLTSMMGCLGGEAGEKLADSVQKDIVESLKSGDFFKFDWKPPAGGADFSKINGKSLADAVNAAGGLSTVTDQGAGLAV